MSEASKRSRREPTVRLGLVAGAIVLFALAVVSSGCGEAAPTPTPEPTATPEPSPTPEPTPTPTFTEPSYMKDVVAYQEGPDGFIAYFTLADEQGRLTAGDGEATMTVRPRGYLDILYQESVEVKASDFKVTQVGVGALAHESLLYSFGRTRMEDVDGAGCFYLRNDGMLEISIDFVPEAERRRLIPDLNSPFYGKATLRCPGL